MLLELLPEENAPLRRLVPRTGGGGGNEGRVGGSQEGKGPTPDPCRPYLIATLCIITRLTQRAFK